MKYLPYFKCFSRKINSSFYRLHFSNMAANFIVLNENTYYVYALLRLQTYSLLPVQQLYTYSSTRRFYINPNATVHQSSSLITFYTVLDCPIYLLTI